MATREAVARADALLLEHLSPEQRDDYRSTRSFLVVTPGGRRYRLHGDRVNYLADLLAPDSEYVLAQYCVQPRDGQIPKSDSLLAQMLLLQTDEALFLFTANVNPKVSSIPRYLSGEIRPREAPSTPQHEPDVRRLPPGYDPFDPNTWHLGDYQFDVDRWHLASNNYVHREVEAVLQPPLAHRVRDVERCADHNNRCGATRETADGRGIDLHFTCGCPPRYVSFRQFEERERQLRNRAVQTGRAVMGNPGVRRLLADVVETQMEQNW